MKLWSAAELADTRARVRAEDTISSGFGWLERHVGPCLVGDVVVIAGRRNAGKSHLALAMLAAQARAGYPAVYASLEDGVHRVGRRVRAGYTVDGLYCAWPAKTTSALVEMVERTAADGVRVWCVDYLQRVAHDGPETWGRTHEVAAIIDALKAAVGAARGMLVLLSQAKQPAKDEDGTAPPGDYACRDSAAIEDMADIVLTVGVVRGTVRVRLTKAKDASTGETFAMDRDQATGVLREPEDGKGGVQDDGRGRHDEASGVDDEW